MSLAVSKPRRFRRGGGVVSPSLSEVILATQPSRLLGYYKCDDVSGALVDSSGNSNDLNLLPGSGHTYQQSGALGLGDAVTGGGSGGWARASIIGTFIPSTGLTFGAVVKRNTIPGTIAEQILAVGNASLVRAYELSNLNASFFLNAGVDIGDTATQIDVFQPSNTTNFSIITIEIVTLPAITVRGYIDGVQINSGLFPAINANVLNTIGVLARYINGTPIGFYYDCTIQHAFFYNIGLSETEILAIHTASGLT